MSRGRLIIGRRGNVVKRGLVSEGGLGWKICSWLEFWQDSALDVVMGAWTLAGAPTREIFI
jgi:hypothetical protein